MYETEFLTAGLTIIGGVFIFVVVEILNQFLIKPIIDLKEVIGKITYALMYYSDLYTNPNLSESRREEYKKDSSGLRHLASELGSPSAARI